MKVYLAGPMRGHKLHNFPAFMRAAMDLRSRGFYVFNPADCDIAEGFDPSKAIDHPDNAEAFDLAEAFEWDFNCIKNSEAVVLLPGWENSKGVQAELVLAMALEKRVYEYKAGVVVDAMLTDYSVKFETAPCSL